MDAGAVETREERTFAPGGVKGFQKVPPSETTEAVPSKIALKDFSGAPMCITRSQRSHHASCRAWNFKTPTFGTGSTYLHGSGSTTIPQRIILPFTAVNVTSTAPADLSAME
jgi:hypothetical protein